MICQDNPCGGPPHTQEPNLELEHEHVNNTTHAHTLTQKT